MNWKEFIGGVVAAALLLLFALWTTDFEIGSNSGFVIANVIICLISILWRIILNPFVSNNNISLKQLKSYIFGIVLLYIIIIIKQIIYTLS